MRLLAAAVTLVSSVCSAETTAPNGRLDRDTPIPAESLESFVDGVVGAGMLATNVAGVSVAVVQGDRPILLKGYGLADLDPARLVDANETLFRAGSISKLFTWMLVMREVERGRIDLEAPVNQYLPRQLQFPEQGFAEPIRIRHLMSHSLGTDSPTAGLFVRDPQRIRPLEERLQKQRPDRVYQPGVMSSYSNYGTVLAGYIVAQLNGVDFETLVERGILAPLRLQHTTFRQPHPPREGLPAPMSQALADHVSTGFAWNGNDYKARPFEFTSAASGSLSITAADMARLMLVFLNEGSLDGATLYSPATSKAFRTPLMDVPAGINGWAHGFIVYSLPGGFDGYGHSGGMLSFYSNVVVIPELDLGVFVTTNTTTGWGIAERLPGAIVERFYVERNPPTRMAGSPTIAAQPEVFAGRYLVTRRAYSGLERFRYLVRAPGEVSVTPDGYLLALEQKWAEDGVRGRFRSLDGAHLLQFQFDADGKAVRFLEDYGSMVSERAGPLLDLRIFYLLAGLTLLGALAKLTGVASSIGRELSQTPWQRNAHVVACIVAGAWLIAFYAFYKWMTTDSLTRVYEWPGTALVTASSVALLASLLSVVLLGLLPMALRGDAGWSAWRKARHAFMVLVFILFAGMLAAWSALVPWRT